MDKKPLSNQKTPHQTMPKPTAAVAPGKVAAPSGAKVAAPVKK